MNKEDIIIEQLANIQATLELLLFIESIKINPDDINKPKNIQKAKVIKDLRDSKFHALLSQLLPEKFPSTGEKK